MKPPDDHPAWVRVFGRFRSREAADVFCEKVRAACEVGNGDGFAYVLELEPRIGAVRRARRWATKGER